MPENDKSINKSQILWERIKVSKKFKEKILKHRRRMNIPQLGFSSYSKYLNWSQSGKHDYASYLSDCEELFPKGFQHLVRTVFAGQLMAYLHSEKSYYEILDDSLKDLPLDEMCYISVLPGEERTIGDGFYIRISPYATQSEIKSFLKDVSDDVKTYQREAKKILELPQKRARIRVATKTDRDTEIFRLSKCTKDDLINQGFEKKTYKSSMIAHHFGLTQENVERIIKEQRRLRQ